MIKIVTLLTKFIVTVLLALLFSSCRNNNVGTGFFEKSITGSGIVTTENRLVEGDFKTIEVSNAIELTVEQAPETKITVIADDNVQKHITTKVENGVLKIACDYNSFINVKSKKVTVKTPIIEGLQASSASNIKNRGVIKGLNLNLDASSAAGMDLDLEFENVFINSSSGSQINLNGKALKFETKSSSGSQINATDLLVNDIIADASSGASISIHPIVSLKAEASSGANINYNTHPKQVHKKTSSGGSIDEN